MTVECPYLSELPDLKHAFLGADHREKKHSVPLVTLKQVHGTRVIHVSGPLEQETEGDGLVTKVKGLALGIRTADCGPVLFYDPIAGVIGACHAGWRGARNGILQATLKSMEEEGAQRSHIYATLGPTIQKQDYEVGPEFSALFDEVYLTHSLQEGHHYFDLPRFICDQLLNEGVTYVHDVEKNTFTENFASRRRFLSQGIDKVIFDNLSMIAIM